MIFTKDKIRNFELSSRKEWLITNGIGGFSSSTIIGLNTRKYHALLVAALGNSGERYVVLPKLNEYIVIDNETYSLSTNQCSNFTEKGYESQESFKYDFYPEFCFDVGGVKIVKKIAMQYGENKVAVSYTIKTSDYPATFKIQPLVNYRNFHSTRNCDYLDYTAKDLAVNVKLNSHGLVLHMLTSDGIFEKFDRTYYRNMFYEVEEERGLEAYENHFMPGTYLIDIPKNKEIVFEFVALVNNKDNYIEEANANDIILREKTRLEKVCKVANAKSELEKILTIAADSFVVTRGDRKTIIAGYPWFGDWGRDTFIAFEGLLLKTNRFKDAKQILVSFSKYIKNGLIPNLIGEDGGSAYNTVDASLLYINAIYRYYKYTRDIYLVNDLFPKITEIIEAYKNGTSYNIYMDKEDLLISAGTTDTQLTWMDAKIDSIIPTPRNGKPVEINALWYNALKIIEYFANKLNNNSSFLSTDTIECINKVDFELSEKVKKSFKKFYSKNGLYDVIDPISEDIRPNQIFACGLDFSVVDDDKAKEILSVVEDKLYTDKGLKTLSNDNINYKPYYEGNSYSRDMSYHQGTVWPWLSMLYFNASRKYGGKYKNLEDAYEMLNDDCIGNICEIYDASFPRMPKGAYAQAWSVAMAILNI